MCNNDLVRTRKAFIRVYKKMALSLYDLMTVSNILHIFTKSDSFSYALTFTTFSSVEGFLRFGPKRLNEMHERRTRKTTTNIFYCATEIFGYTPNKKETENSFNMLFSENSVACFTNILFCIIKYSVTALKTKNFKKQTK